jgi:hypothetical protein
LYCSTFCKIDLTLDFQSPSLLKEPSRVNDQHKKTIEE